MTPRKSDTDKPRQPNADAVERRELRKTTLMEAEKVRAKERVDKLKDAPK